MIRIWYNLRLFPRIDSLFSSMSLYRWVPPRWFPPRWFLDRALWRSRFFFCHNFPASRHLSDCPVVLYLVSVCQIVSVWRHIFWYLLLSWNSCAYPGRNQFVPYLYHGTDIHKKFRSVLISSLFLVPFSIFHFPGLFREFGKCFSV